MSDLVGLAQSMRCRLCDEVIGVYEPLVVLLDGVPRRTSRPVAEAEQLIAPCFHADCFAEHGARSTADRCETG
jgi:hypothetical protein